MTTNQQLSYHPIQQQRMEFMGTDELAVIRNRRAVKRFKREEALNVRILKAIAVTSIASASLCGIGALGCWGLEIVEANTKPVPISKQHDWQIRKHICFSWMLVGFSSFLGSVSFGKKS